MRHRFSRLFLQGKDRGAVMFLVAGTVLIVLLMGAVAVDLSVVATRGQNMQNAADSAALAGVQAYRNSIGDSTTATAADQAAATAAVMDLLEQNGITAGGSVTVDVTFPDSTNETEVQVTITDSDPDLLLAGVTGVGSTVERTATARFEKCAGNCIVEVEIPAPFSSVNATGTGDGYKPIPVDNKLYALNHNSSYGGIVCIDRATEDHCWTSGASKPAYATGANTQRNPEMPHTAVYGTKIYWTASDGSGTHVFCFETATATPCSSTFQLNTRQRASSSDISNQKDRNRGGGTVLIGNKIYVFTDDHRVHCVNPDVGAGMSACAGYELNGKASPVGLDNFPLNEPSAGNHGSSIDRIVDDSDRVYWTIHIPNAVPLPGSCSADNMADPSGRVVIKNAWSGIYLAAPTSGGGLVDSTDPLNEYTQWDVIDLSGDWVAFRSVGRGRYIDADGDDQPLDTSSSISTDDQWEIDYQVTTSTIDNRAGDGYMRDSGNFTTDQTLQGAQSDWIIKPYQCEDPLYVPPPTPTLGYASGTWLQCWDTATAGPCSGFVPSRIHSNGERFSGRLFFHTDAGTGAKSGVCSSGYEGSLSVSNFEIECVNITDGSFSSAKTDDLLAFRNAIAGTTDGSPAAWGDPHYNEDENRLFYPSAHDNSKVLCWDFDYGFCGSRTGVSPSGGYIEDYGFFSEGNCVYGLGHNAIFWAFHAEDINNPCTGSSTKTVIHPCSCSGTYYWGTLEFDVDLALFNSFLVQIVDHNGNVLIPADPLSPGHSLHTDGEIIDLNHLAVNDPINDYLEILVTVDADNDPWAVGAQKFSIQFARAPRLVE